MKCVLGWAACAGLMAGIAASYLGPAQAQPSPTVQPSSTAACRIESTDFDGWKAERIVNGTVEIVIVPQLGGRVMQVTFAGHPYLFVNPQYRGQYIPPSQTGAKGGWINYGGDKIWPMPEGSQDDHHWPGPISDELDDGEYAFHVLSQGNRCAVRLDGPPDPKTGLQYSREISAESGSPAISFHAVMKNISNHPIEWSMQSVTQYDTADARQPADFNHDFWAFAPANSQSAYLDRYHVRSGLAEDPSFSVSGELFALHWLYLQSEVWIDSPGDWIAVADESTHFAMVERFKYQAGADYPGKATVIFYKNGPGVEVNGKGMPVVRLGTEDQPYYMEAELNSPIVRLNPDETYAMDTRWFPARVGDKFVTATTAGVVSEPLSASRAANQLTLSGSFGVFYSGKLVAHLYDDRGAELNAVPLQPANPAELTILDKKIQVPPGTARVSVRLSDDRGVDRGSLGDANVARAAGGS
ncbi:MAG: hypothetical protein ACRD4S_12220 [Candidatus Acidiferrales bacterium]